MGRLGPWWLVLLLSWAVPGSVWGECQQGPPSLSLEWGGGCPTSARFGFWPRWSDLGCNTALCRVRTRPTEKGKPAQTGPLGQGPRRHLPSLSLPEGVLH